MMRQPQSDSLRSTLLQGAVAGFAATIPMTLFMLAMHSRLPWHERYPLPPRQIVENVAAKVGVKHKMDEPDRQAVTLLTHFGFGAATGALYALLADRFRDPPRVQATPLAARVPIPPILSGLIYGLIVWSASYLGWLPAARILPPATDHPARRNILMILAHLVWGSVLALLVQRAGSKETASISL